METCYKLAEYFHADPRMVLEMAGYEIPESSTGIVREPDSINMLDPDLRLQLYDLGRRLTAEEMGEVIESIKAYLRIVKAGAVQKEQREGAQEGE